MEVEQYLIQDLETLAKGKFAPQTIFQLKYSVKLWAQFLRQNKIRRDRVTIEDFRTFEKQLINKGRKSSYIQTTESNIRTYYSLKAEAKPRSKWVTFYAQLRAHRKPKIVSSISPHKPFPLRTIPKVLQASEQRKTRINGRKGHYDNEDHVLIALFTYSGMRAQAYGLRVSDLDFDSQLITTRVKGGHEIYVPMHTKLKEILEEHLRSRQYDSDMVFRHGRYPYTYTNGGSFQKDNRASWNNRNNVTSAMKRVRAELLDQGIEEHVTAHRFRKSVGTYAKKFGLDERERQILLGHGAKTITQAYDMEDISEVRRKWDQIDLGSEEWVQANLEVTNGIILSPTPENGGSETLQELKKRIKANHFTKEEKLELISALMET